LLPAGLLISGHARAQLTGRVAATTQFESNSNVFDVNSGSPLPVAGDTKRSDTFYSYGALFDASYAWSRQELHAAMSAAQYEYQHYKSLNHTAYSLNVGSKLKFADPLDGSVDVYRSRTMVPFYNLSGTALALSLVTDQRETGTLRWLLNSKWRLEGTASADRSNQPVLGAPDLELYQNQATAALDYLGINGITSGLTVGYLAGEYLGSINDSSSRFHETQAGLTAKYEHIRSTFDGQIGYTRRVSANGFDNTSGLTGLIDFTENLTPRTSFTARVDRKINSYLATAGSEIDTDLGASLRYRATYKSSVSVGYTFSYRDFPGQGNNPVGSKRVDIQEFATMEINYQPRRWLFIKPYMNIQTRRSTFVGGHFSSTIFGVNLTVSTPDSRRKPQ